MRFSFWPDGNQAWQDILALAQHVERTGWDGFWFADHFMPDDVDTSEPCHEVWTILSAVAALVPRIRVGPLVACNTYRHPAVLAKMAASLDHVSNGRLVLGLGSGWQENEHTAYGLEFDTVGGRLRRLAEACEIVRSLFEQSRSDFSGRYYSLADAPLEPKPVQERLPLLIGGGGEKVTLKITAKYADEWHVWGDVATFVHKSRILDQHCEAIGRDPGSIVRSTCALVHCTDDANELARLRRHAPDYPTLIGTPAELIDVLSEYAEAGVDEFILPDFNLPAGPAKFDHIDFFKESVAARVA